MPAPRVPGLVASGLVLGAIGLRLVVSSDGGPDLPNRLVPALIAAAALCVAGLAFRRGPALAWFATVLASGIGAVEIVALVRTWEPMPSGGPWLALTLVAALASLAAASVAGRYAAVDRAGRFGSAAQALAWVGLGLVVGGELWAIASAAGETAAGATTGAAAAGAAAGPDVVPIRIATRLMLGTVIVLGLVGAARDALPPARRAWARRIDGTTYPRLLIEELVPAWGASRRAAAEQERATLAAELHARVVPELRSVLAATAGSDPDGALSERLRSTLDDVEALMAERHSVVLEEFGLLAALEWLVERVQARSASEVMLEVDDLVGATGPAAEPARPPRDVERAAFRVALLAVDNATRHAPGSAIAIRTAIGPRAIEVEVADRGPGLAPDRANDAARTGRRGLLDMRSEAAAVGASLVIARADAPNGTDPGTRVTFRWPSA